MGWSHQPWATVAGALAPGDCACSLHCTPTSPSWQFLFTYNSSRPCMVDCYSEHYPFSCSSHRFTVRRADRHLAMRRHSWSALYIASHGKKNGAFQPMSRHFENGARYGNSYNNGRQIGTRMRSIHDPTAVAGVGHRRARPPPNPNPARSWKLPKSEEKIFVLREGWSFGILSDQLNQLWWMIRPKTVIVFIIRQFCIKCPPYDTMASTER